jgi:hypothetical protein
MHAFEDTINQYLNAIGIVIIRPFADLPETNPVVRFAVITHLNIITTIILDDQMVHLTNTVGYLPKQNIAPLFRRLLNLNSTMSGPFFSVGDDVLSLQIRRQQEGLDLIEFKWMLDQTGTMYWQFAAGLVQEFQIPQQPV